MSQIAFEALATKKVGEKTIFVRLGAAFPNKSGQGYTVVLDAMPAPIDGCFRIQLVPPRPKPGERASSDANGDIPF